MKKIIELKIEAVADKGVAIGRHEGKAVFVRFGAPGDVARVELVEEKPGWARGEIVELTSPSPHRAEPKCPHFSVCGGCAWQHLDQGVEIAGKTASLVGFFRARLGLPEEAFAPTMVSPLEYGYRNRLTLNIAASSGVPLVGMTGFRSHRLVEIGACPVASPPVNRALNALIAAKRQLPAPSRLLLQEDSTSKVWAVLSVDKELDGAKAAKLAAMVADAGLAGVWLSVGGRTPAPLRGSYSSPMNFSAHSRGREMAIEVPVGAFVQANSSVSAAMVETALSHSSRFAGGNAVDFYCGSGNFTLPMALVAGKVTGVEGDRRAAGAAERNAARAGLANVSIISSPVERSLPESGKGADFWLLDPPRAGAPELASQTASGPPAIFYVSCDPATMARDLKTMMGNGYTVETVRAADMFPRTAHLEVTALLTRRF